jgi:hypothetical protein
LISFTPFGKRHTLGPPSLSIALENSPAFGFKQLDRSVDELLKQGLDTMLRDQAYAQFVQGVVLATPSPGLPLQGKAALI